MGDIDDWRASLISLHGDPARHVLARVAAVAADLPDEGRAVTDLRQFLEAGGVDDVAQRLRRFQDDPLAIELLLRLAGSSRYAFEVALQYPEMFWSVAADRLHRQVWGRRTMLEQLERDMAAVDGEDARIAQLGLFKHHQSLRVILGDLTGQISFEAAVRELSDLVDVIAQAAYTCAYAKLLPRLPADHVALELRFSAMAMGKLGARELNYSSDIDLIFLYDAKAVDTIDFDHHAWFQRLGTTLIRILEEPGPSGRMFRVDMRLRPEGDRGELALSYRETIDYYYSVGRPWERQALIKARPIAGDLALGTRLLDELRPWVYPQDPQWEDLEEARSMRRRIEERAEAANVKTGAGGIRDIEFLVQYFQLVHGGRMAELRDPSTLPTLRILADRGIIPRPDAAELERHYLWLRTVEHRLQMWQDRQEHELPKAADERANLARRSSFRGVDALTRFDDYHARTRARVRELVGRHFLGVTVDSEALLALLVQGEADVRLAGKVLGTHGFRDVAKACADVRSLAVEPFFVLSRNRTERKLVEILPLLLHHIAGTPDPGQTLSNFSRIVSAVGGRATFYELLGTRPAVLRMFVDLAGWSNFLVTLFQDFAGLPDEVIDSLNQPLRKKHALFAEARSLAQGLQNLAEPLAYMQARETAVVAIRDLEGLDPRDVGHHLSSVAETILEVTLIRVIQERARQYGIPQENGRPTRFAVLGLGKLGARELSYASDMDIIFVCDPGGICKRGRSGGENLAGDDFWTKVAQDLMRTMTDGRLYELDPRLRPYGTQGELVSNTAALGHYWSQPRDLWERMAMLRVAHLAGDPRLGEEAVQLIQREALMQPLPRDSAGEVKAMRRRLEESVAGRDHLKRGWGGYNDHEFIAQYCSLGLAPSELPRPPATDAMLVRLGESGRIPEEAADQLASGVRRLRFIESRMRLSAGKAVSSIPTERGPRDELAKRCDFRGIDALDAELHHLRETARRWFEQLIC
ncbi:MAG: bifunctional [glutamate--ammonia ligase]-adenylyl-L-tyrosine phosphorylase/[glutamate--ammonia-ligase] adenylyltransferase [Planctomycetes bacterium]|nr:bifunctional [glutamate--ammonia ligase]-adenylyl-L-tyrosine phosphorylase/[glutamate--ammonia-ligase] adenylyltransferase [Planctomycetota bacterium]